MKETRSGIKLCVKLGKTPNQTIHFLEQAHHTSHVSRSPVFKWHKLFLDGEESVDDDPGRDRQKL